MAEALNVDPVDLFMSADHLGMHHGELIEVHDAANASIEVAAAGWVGSSAAALQDKIPDLVAVTTQVADELARYRDAFRVIGHRYDQVDENAAAEVMQAGRNL